MRKMYLMALALFSSGGALAMALSAAWDDAFEGTW